MLVSTSDSVSAYNLDLNLHTCEASLSIEVHVDIWQAGSNWAEPLLLACREAVGGRDSVTPK